MPPSPGERITSPSGTVYVMGQKIGEGAFGVVYECADSWGNSLAAKVLRPRGTYETVKARAEAEIEKLLRVRHPNITFLFDAFECRDAFYLITERCHFPVADLFKMEGLIGSVWLMPVARCLLQATEYLHRHGLIHADIHAGNVFGAYPRNEMGTPPPPSGPLQFKLGDLGVAKVFGPLQPENTLAQWMLPPEAINPMEFGPADHRIDIYHAGLLLLQLALSRSIIFSREEIFAGRPRELALTLPAPWNTALEKSLRRHVPHRTGNARQLWLDLNVAPPPLPPLTPAQKG